MPENNNIELRSEEVQEILGSPPSWIIRIAITTILLILITLIIGSYFYKYPDFINARITIISENPPIPVIAKTSGKLQELLVVDRQLVKAGQVIGIIENPAKFSDVIKLKLFLDSIICIFDTPEEFVSFAMLEQLTLGQNQSYYAAFVSQWSEYVSFIQFDYYGQQMKSLSNQVSDYHYYLMLLQEQVEILRKNLDLSAKQLARDSMLYSNEVMPELQFEQSQASFLKQKYSYKSAHSNLLNTQIKINQLEQQLLELAIQEKEQEKMLSIGLKERFENLNAQIAVWEQTYVLKTPIEGLIAFTDLWSVKQYIHSGSVAFTIVPDKEQRIIGKLVIPVAGSGKVEKGKKVNIKLDNFPYMEYGLIEGIITNISLVPVLSQDGNYYTADIKLNNGLKTNYNIQLPFNQEMQGVAEIITKDKRLIERLIQPLKAIFKKNIQ